MLTCFLKGASDGKARIIKYEDRVWISKTGDADVMRRFWIQVERESSAITSLNLFVPLEAISNVKSLHGFSDSADYPFNDYRRFTVRTEIVPGREENIIDGIDYKVCEIAENQLTIRQVGEGKSIDFDFSKNKLSPGSTYLIAISFTIKKLIDLEISRVAGEIFCQFYYFSPLQTPQMLACIKENRVIPVIPLLPPDKGGFVVFLYGPDGYELTPCDEGPVQRSCEWDYLGNPTKPLLGLLWDLATLMRRQSKEPMSEQLKFENGAFSFPFVVRAVMREAIYLKDVRRANTLAWIAIVIGGAGLIGLICSLLF